MPKRKKRSSSKSVSYKKRRTGGYSATVVGGGFWGKGTGRTKRTAKSSANKNWRKHFWGR